MTTSPVDSDGLAGRIALVTGASGGIGMALTDRLLAAGVTVVATSRDPDRTDLGQLAAGNPALQVLAADMDDAVALAALVDRVVHDHGRLDLLLPNAGVAEVRTLEELSLADWQRSLDVNLTAPFQLAQAAAAGMRDRSYGRILFTSSVAAYTGGFVGPHYAAAKAGLHGLVHFLSSRLASAGVTANAIAPALIADTAMIEGLPAGQPPPNVPVGRLGRPAEVADLAMAVLSNGYLTGQVLILDGGLHPT